MISSSPPMLALGAAASTEAANEAPNDAARQSIKMTNFSIAAIMNSSKKVAEAAAAAAAAAAAVDTATRNPFLVERPIPFKLEPFSPLGMKVLQFAVNGDFFYTTIHPLCHMVLKMRLWEIHWWAYTVATYCPSRPSQLSAKTAKKQCDRVDE